MRINDINRITASEMKFMRATAGYTRWDNRRIEDILRELQLDSVVHFINTVITSLIGKIMYTVCL